MTMTIPFLSFFKKVKSQALAKKAGPIAEVPPAIPPIEKPSNERFSKTVMPNATRTLPPQDPFEMAARSSALGGQVSSPGPTGSAPSTQRTVAFGGGGPSAARSRDLPPAVALALEPRVERVISLTLGDIVTQMPPDYIKPIESIDGTRRILLKASEVEKGMATGKPAVSLATIYQQVPEIFLRSIAPADTAQVQLPFQKVLDQFSSLQVRRDQERHQSVPQVETPFLKVTLEDNSTFGTTTIEAVEIGDLPPVRIEPPTAEAFAAAEPEAAGSGFFVQPPMGDSNGATPARIPFKLSPNGTDGSATESVPASSGPSVPMNSPTAPTRIPFKMTPPSNDLRPKDEPWLTAETLAAETLAAESDAEENLTTAPETPVASVTENPAGTKSSQAEIRISLPLKPILQGLAPFQLNGDPGTVPAEANVALPFALIEPQLATGRIAITPKDFAAGLPAEYRVFFQDAEATDVILPLHEVLKNLPAASLRMRDDQEESEAGSHFATPFSVKAEEDAKRFNSGEAVATMPVVMPAPIATAAAKQAPAVTEPLPAITETSGIKPFEVLPRNPLQVALGTDETMGAKGVVAEINKFDGVRACAFMFGDGLSLAGTLPLEYETEGLCAMAPSLLQRIENHMVETKLGPLRGMTLVCGRATITFFMHENLCLAALHSGGDLTSEVREKLSRIVHELSRKYTHHPV